ncbi:MAG: hypothetical protein AAF564_00830 [Bacteroidota bacterium]
MPIVSLLKEWSDIEPDRCSHVGDMFAIRGWTLTQETDIADRLVNAEIQCAVQESIEAHGWHWVVGRIAIEKGVYYKGRISIQPLAEQTEQQAPVEQPNPEKPLAQAASPRLNTYLSTHSPTHVLLQAYVDALKVMQTAKPGDEEAIHGEIIKKPSATEPEPAEDGAIPISVSATPETEAVNAEDGTTSEAVQQIDQSTAEVDEEEEEIAEGELVTASS